MTPAEWDRLAWWEQMTYLDGYVEEGILTRDEGGEPGSRIVAVHHDGGTTITEREAKVTFSGEPGEMAAFGLHETTLG